MTYCVRTLSFILISMVMLLLYDANRFDFKHSLPLKAAIDQLSGEAHTTARISVTKASEFDYNFKPQGRAFTPIIDTNRSREPAQNPLILVWQAPYCPSKAVKRGDGYCIPEKYTMPCTESTRAKCRITTDRRLLKDADAVVIPLASQAKVTRENELRDMKPSAVLVSWGAEAPTSKLGRHAGPDPLFNWTMSYRHDSDVPFPYLWDIFFRISTEKRFEGRGNVTMFEADALRSKVPEASAVVGNCIEERKKMLNSIATMFPSKLKGRCWSGEWVEDHELTRDLQHSLFHYAFENSYCMDYITEKYWRVLTWGSIPLVNGPPEAYPGAPINTNNFNSSKEFAKYLHRVVTTPSLLHHHLSYRPYAAEALHPVQGNRIGWCELCNRLTSSQPHQHYPSIEQWISHGNQACPDVKGPSWHPGWVV
eukprot:TRINITY_DN765_c4_g6_i1.p1 TRINITY_DN765_c4_g6~~TRINITY_DN765_c4_g6_i1.p1  ORF type:complete len:436 (+),score=40.73 TRINITY_DN765_c4_g6_i1:41-1309(+)